MARSKTRADKIFEIVCNAVKLEVDEMEISKKDNFRVILSRINADEVPEFDVNGKYLYNVTIFTKNLYNKYWTRAGRAGSERTICREVYKYLFKD